MEEKNPQKFQADKELIEEVTDTAESTKAESTEIETIEEPVEGKNDSAESDATEPLEEPVETEPEIAEVEAPTVDERVEETFEEEPVEESIDEDAKEIPARAVPKGLMLQTWQLAVAAVIVVAMIAGGVVLGMILGNRNDGDGFSGSPVDYDWELQSGSATNDNQIVLPGYDDLLFPANETKIEMILPNHKSNPCYFRYTLMLKDTGEILYQTPLIAPGQAMLEIELLRELSKGDYQLIIAIDCISLTDGRTPLNGGEHHVVLRVR